MDAELLFMPKGLHLYASFWCKGKSYCVLICINNTQADVERERTSVEYEHCNAVANLQEELCNTNNPGLRALTHTLGSNLQQIRAITPFIT